MADATESHLRNRPRQARSAARVELLLDVAEAVFEEVGYDAATTNLVASRAGVPVGTLYRWFPDKNALAEALADRYLEQLLGLYGELLTDIDPGERIGEFLRRVMGRLVEETVHLQALPALLVSAMVPGGRSSAGERLRAGLEGHIRGLMELRVPGIPDDLRDRSAEVVVTLAHLVIASAAEAARRPDAAVDAADDAPATGFDLTDEYVDVLLAYLDAKFPSADSPAWSDPSVVVKPVFAAPNRATRLASKGGTRD